MTLREKKIKGRMKNEVENKADKCLSSLSASGEYLVKVCSS